MSQETTESHSSHLSRSLGLWAIVALGLGYMTPTVIFDTFGIVSDETAGVVPTAYGLALLAMGMYLSLLNQANADPYFTQTLQTWEQGRFIRFHGLVQWLGWLWPYAAVVVLLQHVRLQDREN